jgi:hypothetical protein
MKFGRNHLSWGWGDIIIAPNKSFEYQFSWGGSTPTFHPFELSFLITSKRDHCGPSVTFGIMNLFWMCLKVYDHRHWNNKEDRWYNPGETVPDEDEEC